MSTRIYIVTNRTNDAKRLVRAANVSQAVKFIARETMHGELASQEELVAAVASGMRVEDATAVADKED